MQALDLHIVVVDDNPVIRRSYRDVVEEAGCAALEAASADEALRMIEAEGSAVDVVITDIEMPGSMDGIGLAQLIARRWPRIGVIVNSGHLEPLPGELPSGAIFMSKPGTANILLHHIASFSLRETGGRSAGPGPCLPNAARALPPSNMPDEAPSATFAAKIKRQQQMYR